MSTNKGQPQQQAADSDDEHTGQGGQSGQPQVRRVGQSNKVKPRELKAIQKGYQQFQKQLDREKEQKQSKTGEKPDLMEDREMKKMRMYEEMFLKKAQEEERKRKLKEKREIRKQLSVGASASKDKRGDGIDVISEANQVSARDDSQNDSVDKKNASTRGGGRGATRSYSRGRGRGRGRRGRRGRGQGFSQRKQQSATRRRVIKDEDEDDDMSDDEDASSKSDDEDEDDDDEDEGDEDDDDVCSSQDDNDAADSEDEDKGAAASNARPSIEVRERRTRAAKLTLAKKASAESSVAGRTTRRRVSRRQKVVVSSEQSDVEMRSVDEKKSNEQLKGKHGKRSGYASADEANPPEKSAEAASKEGKTVPADLKKIAAKKATTQNEPGRKSVAIAAEAGKAALGKSANAPQLGKTATTKGQKAAEALSNSSERRAAAKSKDAEILFGEQTKNNTVLTKRPRVLSNQQDKDLKELALEKESKVQTAAPPGKNNDAGDGVSTSKEQKAAALVGNTATKRALVQASEESKGQSAATKLKEVVKQALSNTQQPKTSTQQKLSASATNGIQATGSAHKTLKKVNSSAQATVANCKAKPTSADTIAEKVGKTSQVTAPSAAKSQAAVNTQQDQASKPQAADQKDVKQGAQAGPSKVQRQGQSTQGGKGAPATKVSSNSVITGAQANNYSSIPANAQDIEGSSLQSEPIAKKLAQKQIITTSQALEASPAASSDTDAIIAATKALMARPSAPQKLQANPEKVPVQKQAAQGQGQDPAAPLFRSNLQGSQGQVMQPPHAKLTSTAKISQKAAEQQQPSQQNAAMANSGASNNPQAGNSSMTPPAFTTQPNACGAFPIFFNNKLVPYNEFMREMNKLCQSTAGQQQQKDGRPGEQPSQNNPNQQQSQNFCLVQTKVKLANELSIIQEQYNQVSIALQYYRQFDHFCQKLAKDYGV